MTPETVVGRCMRCAECSRLDAEWMWCARKEIRMNSKYADGYHECCVPRRITEE